MKKILIFLLVTVYTFTHKNVLAQIVKLDSNFNISGSIYINGFNISDFAYNSSIVEFNKILTSSLSFNPIPFNGRQRLELLLTKHNYDGTLDLAFGKGNGKIFINTYEGSTGGNLGDIQLKNLANEKFLAVYTAGISSTNISDLFITKFNQNGNIDSSFGINGSFVYESNELNYESIGVISSSLNSKKNIYALATFTDGDFSFTNELLVLKISKNGIIDSTFSGDGVQKYPYPTQYSNIISRGIAVVNDNQIILGAYSGGFFGILKTILLSIDSTGAIDYNFEPNGFKILSTNTKMSEMMLDSTGRLIVVGVTGGTSTEDVFAAAIFPDGRLDSTFGINGKASFNLLGLNEAATCMAITPDNKILIGGYVNDPINNPITKRDFLVMRLNSDGSLDSTFNQIGYYTTEFTAGSNRDDEMNGITIDGKRIYLTGTETISHQVNFRAVVMCLRDNTATGLVEQENETQIIKYYPNPTNNEITIEIDEKLVGINYILYDQLGRQLQNGTLNESRSIVNLADLANGMYWVSIGNDSNQSFKVVKQ